MKDFLDIFWTVVVSVTAAVFGFAIAIGIIVAAYTAIFPTNKIDNAIFSRQFEICIKETHDAKTCSDIATKLAKI